jgi:Ras-related protein Rab-1A
MIAIILARQYQIPFYETSAKSSINIDVAFTHMSKNILNRVISSPAGRSGVKNNTALRL